MKRITNGAKLLDKQLYNPVIEQITKHVSVRSFDSKRSLPEGIIDILIGAAQSAPTSSNFQSWSAIVIEDKDRKKQMKELCANQQFIEDAPLFIAFCADASRHKWVTKEKGYPFNSDYLDLLLVSIVDSVLACQNAAIAAESMGLGCCMVGSIRNNSHNVAEFLELPKMTFATVGLAIGYPKYKNNIKPRLPKQIITHKERYSTHNNQKNLIKDYDKIMEKTGIYNGRHVDISNLDFQSPHRDSKEYGWTEHTARRMAKGNDFRKNLASFLERQGFSLN